jgi:hypothetical protein
VIAGLAITTCYKPAPAHLARARVLSERFSAPLVERKSWEHLFAETKASYLYVVGRDHEEVRSAEGANCFVQEGLLSTKLTDGARHPFVRALTGAGAVASILDGTLGLANDALHAAVTTGARVLGVEGSPVIHALLEEGLARLARTYAAASRISLVHGRTLEVLRAQADRSFDVVMLDPMMSRAKKSAPSFNLVRQLAIPDRADRHLLDEAARVANKRVVLKLGKGAPLPADSPFAFEHHEPGSHVIYWVHDVA